MFRTLLIGYLVLLPPALLVLTSLLGWLPGAEMALYHR